jgi:hypothetical protein
MARKTSVHVMHRTACSMTCRCSSCTFFAIEIIYLVHSCFLVSVSNEHRKISITRQKEKKRKAHSEKDEINNRKLICFLFKYVNNVH